MLRTESCSVQLLCTGCGPTEYNVFARAMERDLDAHKRQQNSLTAQPWSGQAGVCRPFLSHGTKLTSEKYPHQQAKKSPQKYMYVMKYSDLLISIYSQFIFLVQNPSLFSWTQHWRTRRNWWKRQLNSAEAGFIYFLVFNSFLLPPSGKTSSEWHCITEEQKWII